jgi:hypothetical protein
MNIGSITCAGCQKVARCTARGEPGYQCSLHPEASDLIARAVLHDELDAARAEIARLKTGKRTYVVDNGASYSDHLVMFVESYLDEDEMKRLVALVDRTHEIDGVFDSIGRWASPSSTMTVRAYASDPFIGRRGKLLPGTETFVEIDEERSR